MLRVRKRGGGAAGPVVSPGAATLRTAQANTCGAKDTCFTCQFEIVFGPDQLPIASTTSEEMSTLQPEKLEAELKSVAKQFGEEILAIYKAADPGKTFFNCIVRLTDSNVYFADSPSGEDQPGVDDRACPLF